MDQTVSQASSLNNVMMQRSNCRREGPLSVCVCVCVGVNVHLCTGGGYTLGEASEGQPRQGQACSVLQESSPLLSVRWSLRTLRGGLRPSPSPSLK